jgi:hypothetical protein
MHLPSLAHSVGWPLGTEKGHTVPFISQPLTRPAAEVAWNYDSGHTEVLLCPC